MTQLKRLSRDREIKGIVMIGFNNDFLRERTLREPNLNFKKVLSLGQSAEERKIYAKQLKQEAKLYRMKYSKKGKTYLQTKKR